MAFHVWQKVVCVDNRARALVIPEWVAFPAIGQVYTIRAIDEWPNETLLRFEELWNDHWTPPGQIEPGFASDRFRPLRETSIECFRVHLAPSPKQQESA